MSNIFQDISETFRVKVNGHKNTLNYLKKENELL